MKATGVFPGMGGGKKKNVRRGWIDDAVDQRDDEEGDRVRNDWNGRDVEEMAQDDNRAVFRLPPHQAISLLIPTGSSKVHGVALFTQETPESPLTISLHLRGLTPKTRHGIHVHAFGDLTDVNVAGLSAGPHLNPFNKPHGCPSQRSKDAQNQHAGDLGVFASSASGEARVRFTSRLMGLYQNLGDGFAIGRALVVHANPDDCGGQPVGNAGGRLAVGVVGVRNETLTVVRGVPVLDESVTEAIRLAVLGVRGGGGGGGGEAGTQTGSAWPVKTDPPMTMTKPPSSPPAVSLSPSPVPAPTGTQGLQPGPTSPPSDPFGYITSSEYTISNEESQQYAHLLTLLRRLSTKPWTRMTTPNPKAPQYNPTLSLISSMDWGKLVETVGTVLRKNPGGGVRAGDLAESVGMLWGLQGVRWEAVGGGEEEWRKLVGEVRGVRWDRVAERLVE
ncbi:Superoxide dismutase [Cu-Zn], partial [Dinochytrium kinnereticum]